MYILSLGLPAQTFYIQDGKSCIFSNYQSCNLSLFGHNFHVPGLLSQTFYIQDEKSWIMAKFQPHNLSLLLQPITNHISWFPISLYLPHQILLSYTFLQLLHFNRLNRNILKTRVFDYKLLFMSSKTIAVIRQSFLYKFKCNSKSVTKFYR